VSRPVRILLAIIAAALLAAPAASASVRLGPDLTPVQDGLGYGCQTAPYTPCSYVNLRSTNSAVPVAAPFSGVITKWRFRAGCCTEPQSVSRTFTLKTFKRGVNDELGGYGYIVAGNTGPSFVLPPGNQVLSDPAVELPARMPIASGERIGIVADYPISFASYNTPGVTLTIPANGVEYQPGEQYGVAYAGALAINAELEPDADGDGYGDESQDCKPADPSFHEACATAPTIPHDLPSGFIPGGKCTGACGGGATLRGPVNTIPGPRGDGGVEISLACPPNATSPCGGILYAELPGGKKPRLLLAAAAAPKPLGKVAYTVKPGKKKTLKLTFSKKVRDFLAQKPTRRITVTIDPKAGKTITRTVVLHFKPPK